MATTFDKALVGIVMGILFLINEFGNVNVGITEGQVTTVLSLLTPFLVWFVPNKKSPQQAAAPGKAKQKPK